MRRFLSSTAAVLFAAAWALPAQVQAAYIAEPADDTVVDDEDTIIDDSEMGGDVIDDSEGGEAPAEGEGEGGDGGGDDVAAPEGGGATSGLFGDEKEVKRDESKVDPESEAKQLKADKAFITVVQRQRFLKKGRVDLMPQFGITVNDPFVRHYVVGAEINYWITNRMAVGVAGHAFFGNTTPRYNNIRFQLGMLLTANRTVWDASANFLYNPFYGKIAVFNRALMHWEAYVQVGGGILQTQVIPRYEALHEPFNNFNPQGNFAIGARFYIAKSDWVSFNFGVRTFLFPDKLEPATRGPNIDAMGTVADNPALDDPSAAKDAAETTLGFNVVAFLGVSFYFPTTFEYTTRR